MNTQAQSTTPAQSGLQKFYRDALSEAGDALDMACLVINQLAALFTVLAMGRPSERTSDALASLGQYIAQDSFETSNTQRAAVWKALDVHDAAGEPGYYGYGRHGIGSAAEAPAHAAPERSANPVTSVGDALAAAIVAVARLSELAKTMADESSDKIQREAICGIVRDVEADATSALELELELLRQRSGDVVRQAHVSSPMIDDTTQPAGVVDGAGSSVLDLENAIYQMRGAAWGLNCALQLDSADHLIDACVSTLTGSSDRLGQAFTAHHAALRTERLARKATNARRFDLRATDSGADLLLLEGGTQHGTVRFDGSDALAQAERAGRDWLRGVDVPAMAVAQKDAWRNAA